MKIYLLKAGSRPGSFYVANYSFLIEMILCSDSPEMHYVIYVIFVLRCLHVYERKLTSKIQLTEFTGYKAFTYLD
jgi:hypothetical protein